MLRYLFAVRGCPAYIRNDNGPEFVSKAVKRWLKTSGIETLYITLGSPWENGYIESFNSKLRDELRYIADRWQMDYNHYRPYSSLDYMSPAAFMAKCLEQGLRLTQDEENSCEILSHNNWYIKRAGQL